MWKAIPLCALGLFVLTTALRIRRINYVTDGVDDRSPNGGPAIRLILPGHRTESFEWLDQSRLMLSDQKWRIRNVDYENAPYGRAVGTPQPYRWWLGGLEWALKSTTGRPLGRAVEWTALIADPLLLVVFGMTAVWFTARLFGPLSGSFLAVGLVTWFPLAAEFTPGTPGDQGLAQICVLWSLLPLLAAADARSTPSRSRRCAVLSGVAGGLGLWVAFADEAPVLGGILVGSLLLAWCERRRKGVGPFAARSLPLREWSLGGALACLGAFVLESYPDRVSGWDLRSAHPLVGLAWLGAAELLGRALEWIRTGTLNRRPRRWGSLAAALVAAGALPVAFWLTRHDGPLVDPALLRLSPLPGSPAGQSAWALLRQNGMTGPLWAALLPLVFAGVGAAAFLPGKANFGMRAVLALALGPAWVASVFACGHVGLWGTADMALLGVGIVAGSIDGAGRLWTLWRWAVGGLFAAAAIAGGIEMWPVPSARTGSGFGEQEVVALVERDLARWLVTKVDPSDAIVLAPPDTTAALYFYGGIRGVDTMSPEDRDGIGAAVRIVSASTPEEAQELIAQRGITHIVIPSWDPYMESFARMGEGELEGTFLERLRKWALPPWLRPVAYLMPTIAGFEGQTVTVLEVVEAQNDAVVASRMSEYFIDTDQIALAAESVGRLRRFPGDAGALAARAEVALALGNQDDFSDSLQVLQRRIGDHAARSMNWESRVRLAIVFARAGKMDLSKVQFLQCMQEVDESKIRSLSTKTLFGFQVLARAFGLEASSPSVRSLALELLPGNLRDRLSK